MGLDMSLNAKRHLWSWQDESEDKAIANEIQKVAKIRRQSSTSFIEFIMNDYCDEFLQKREESIYRPSRKNP